MALREELAAESLGVISNMSGEIKLSDHCGVGATLSCHGSLYGRKFRRKRMPSSLPRDIFTSHAPPTRQLLSVLLFFQAFVSRAG